MALMSSPNLRFLGLIAIPVFTKQRGKKILMVSGRHNLRQTFGSRHLREGAIPNRPDKWGLREEYGGPNLGKEEFQFFQLL